jgi:hypothetical protein
MPARSKEIGNLNQWFEFRLRRNYLHYPEVFLETHPIRQPADILPEAPFRARAVETVVNQLPLNRILFVGIELPSATDWISPKNVVHQVVHAMQVGNIVSTWESMSWVFDVPCEDIEAEDADPTEEPVGDLDSTEGLPQTDTMNTCFPM